MNKMILTVNKIWLKIYHFHFLIQIHKNSEIFKIIVQLKHQPNIKTIIILIYILIKMHDKYH